MREKTVEAKLVKAVKSMGGLAPKFISPGLDGVPDRLVLLPGGKLAFIELKAPGKELRPLQVRRKRQLEALGFLVYCIDSPEQIGGIIHEIQAVHLPEAHTCHLRSSRRSRLTVFHTCCPAWTLSAKKPPVLPSLDS